MSIGFVKDRMLALDSWYIVTRKRLPDKYPTAYNLSFFPFGFNVRN